MGHHLHPVPHVLPNVSAAQPRELPVECRQLFDTGQGANNSLHLLYSPLASSMLAPGVPLILEEFQVDNNQLATFVVSVFVLGYATGPLLIAPLSELYGRNVVYHVFNVLFIIFTVACALADNMGMLVAFRFFAGFAGVTVLTCGSGSIVDLMPQEQRGRAMACWSLGPLIGPVVGPVCAGFFVEEIGWRWVFWIIAIAVSGSLSESEHMLGSAANPCFFT